MHWRGFPRSTSTWRNYLAHTRTTDGLFLTCAQMLMGPRPLAVSINADGNTMGFRQNSGHPYRYSEYTTRVLGATVSTSTLLLPTVTFSFAGSGSEQFDTTPLLASPYV